MCTSVNLKFAIYQNQYSKFQKYITVQQHMQDGNIDANTFIVWLKHLNYEQQEFSIDWFPFFRWIEINLTLSIQPSWYYKLAHYIDLRNTQRCLIYFVLVQILKGIY